MAGPDRRHVPFPTHSVCCQAGWTTLGRPTDSKDLPRVPWKASKNRFGHRVPQDHRAITRSTHQKVPMNVETQTKTGSPCPCKTSMVSPLSASHRRIDPPSSPDAIIPECRHVVTQRTGCTCPYKGLIA